jgi:hypothetical protein
LQSLPAWNIILLSPAPAVVLIPDCSKVPEIAAATGCKVGIECHISISIPTYAVKFEGYGLPNLCASATDVLNLEG